MTDRGGFHGSTLIYIMVFYFSGCVNIWNSSCRVRRGFQAAFRFLYEPYEDLHVLPSK